MSTQPNSSPDTATTEEISYADLITLTAWMAHEGATAEEVAYAVEKPWKHRDWIAAAIAGDPMPED
ncbi:MAG: hypothetical protein L0H78_24240 [Humibacillus sp.]|nr:hypothetical protein [Humibacillus sp.]